MKPQARISETCQSKSKHGPKRKFLQLSGSPLRLGACLEEVKDFFGLHLSR